MNIIRLMLLITFLVCSVHAEKKNVLVKPVTTNTIGHLFTNSFYDALCSNISSSKKYSLTDEKIFIEKVSELDTINLKSDVNTMRVASVMGIDFIVKSDISILNDAFTFNFKLLDVNKGDIVNQIYIVSNDSFQYIIKDSIPSFINQIFDVTPNKILSKPSIINLDINGTSDFHLTFEPDYSNKNVIFEYDKNIIALDKQTVNAHHSGVSNIVIISKKDSSVQANIRVIVAENKQEQGSSILTSKNVIRGTLAVLSAVSLGIGLHNDGMISDKQDKYDSSKNYDELSAIKTESSDAETTRNIAYSLSAVSAVGIGFTFIF